MERWGPTRPVPTDEAQEYIDEMFKVGDFEEVEEDPLSGSGRSSASASGLNAETQSSKEVDSHKWRQFLATVIVRERWLIVEPAVLAYFQVDGGYDRKKSEGLAQY
jgi:hypothetical protein